MNTKKQVDYHHVLKVDVQNPQKRDLIFRLDKKGVALKGALPNATPPGKKALLGVIKGQWWFLTS